MTNEELINNIVSQYIAQLKVETKVSGYGGKGGVKVEVKLKCGNNLLSTSSSTTSINVG